MHLPLALQAQAQASVSELWCGHWARPRAWLILPPLAMAMALLQEASHLCGQLCQARMQRRQLLRLQACWQAHQAQEQALAPCPLLLLLLLLRLLRQPPHAAQPVPYLSLCPLFLAWALVLQPALPWARPSASSVPLWLRG